MISAQIEVWCSSDLLGKYVPLQEAFKGLFEYYIEVRECDENNRSKDRPFMLDLCEDEKDVCDE